MSEADILDGLAMSLLDGPTMHPVPLSDRVLMGPGPCNPYPEVAAAFARPMLGHLDPEFIDLLDETGDRLREVFRTANPLTLPVSGTGSAGMEAAFVNVVRPGDVVVVGRQRGVRRAHVRRRRRAAAPRSCGSRPSGAARSIRRRSSTPIRPRSVIAVVHAETSTGVRNDVACLGQQLRHRRRGARARRLRHLARRHPRRDRRLAGRPGLQRHPEVPRRAARARRRSPPGRGRSSGSSSAARVLVPRPQHDRPDTSRARAHGPTTTPRRSR